MKTSNIKTNFSLERAGNLTPIAQDIKQGSLQQLIEGHFSQAFGYETIKGDKRVIRIGRKLHSFEADKYAYEHFNSSDIPVPTVLEIGEIEPNLYYCTSEFADGVPSDQLNPEEFAQVRDAIETAFAAIFKVNVADSSGWGRLDVATGNGKHQSYVEVLQKAAADLEQLKNVSEASGIDPDLVHAFARNLEENLPSIQVQRRLTHADLGFDNVIVKDGKVSAIIDWSGVAYGDWLHDYSRLEFWHPDRHTSALEFAQKHDLDTQTFDERRRVYMADHALSTLEYAFRYEDASTRQWLRDNLASKIK